MGKTFIANNCHFAGQGSLNTTRACTIVTILLAEKCKASVINIKAQGWQIRRSTICGEHEFPQCHACKYLAIIKDSYSFYYRDIIVADIDDNSSLS